MKDSGHSKRDNVALSVRILRILQLLIALVVLGLISHFLHFYDQNKNYPGGRLIYVAVIASLSCIASTVTLWFCGHSLVGNLIIDGFMTVAWFVAFGVQESYLHGDNCQTTPFNIHYAARIGGQLCTEWHTSNGLSIFNGVFFLVTLVIMATRWFRFRRQNHSHDHQARRDLSMG